MTVRAWWGRRTLRVRVVAVLLTLLAGVSGVIGTVAVLALDHYLGQRIDDQLAAASGRSQNNNRDDMMMPGMPGMPGIPGPTGTSGTSGTSGLAGAPGRYRRGDLVPEGIPGFLLAPGQAEGTIGARLVADDAGRLEVAEAGVLDRDGQPRALADAERARLLSAVTPEVGSLVTVDLGGDLGEYRVVSTQARGMRLGMRLSRNSVDDADLLVTGLPLAPVQATVRRTTSVVVAVAAAGLALAGALGWLVVGRTLLPLRRVALTARRVTAMPLDRGQVDLDVRVPSADADPGTEVGQVGAALNTLLDHMTDALNARHESETRVRRFVADASHELRTPLAVIRGYAELHRRDPELLDSLPDQVVESLARIEGSSLRMSALVDDLLLLARLDSGRPLAADPVDLGEVCADAFADAAVAGPEHEWSLDVPDAPVMVRGDAVRLHQVVANLLANARTHTPPGTSVSLALSVEGREGGEGGTAVVRVRDDGPGIDPAVVPDIFGRFVRADSSRSRAAGAAGSTGLGLAIVAAVVEAHRGKVEVDSALGRGATFTVRLPQDRVSDTEK